MSSLTEAIRYIDLGWSVIPIIKGSKKPTKSWKEYQSKKMNAVDAISLFSGDVNIGLVCGDISGVLVIDEDSYKKTGESDLVLESPLFATTPRGGKHYYFKYKEGGNTVNQELAVDIRSKGGYVLLPPSVVKYEDGQSGDYKWSVEPTKEILDTLPEAPESLLRRVYGQSGIQSQVDIFSTRTDDSRASFDTSSALNVKEGGRNNSLSKLALSLLNKHGQDVAWSLVNGANQTFDPPLSDSEVLTVFNSALKRYKENPPKQFTKTNPVLSEPIVNNEFKFTTLQEDVAGAKKIYLEGKTMGESTGYSKLDDIIGGYIPGQSYLIYADTSIGKSVFAINSLVSLSQRGVKTLYFDLENPMELTVERLIFSSSLGLITIDEWRKAKKNKNEKLINEVLSRVEKLSLEIWDLNKLTERFGDITWVGIKKCIEEAVDKGVRVVVIDHLHYFSPSETDHAVLGEVMRQVNNLCANYNLSIVVVAHTKKGLTYTTKDDEIKVLRPTMDQIAGSGLISKHCKNVMSLQRNPASPDKNQRENTTLFVDKTKFGPTGNVYLRFAEDSLCFFQVDDGSSFNSLDDEWDNLCKKVEDEFSKKEDDEEEYDDITQLVDDLVKEGKW